MRDVPVSAVGNVPASVREAAQRALSTHRTLADVLSWSRQSAADVREIITQDEYTHDVVVAWNEWYLVFDTT